MARLERGWVQSTRPTVRASPPRLAGTGTGLGAVYIYDSGNGSLLNVIPSRETDDRFGFAVAEVADLDHDGCSEYLIGSPTAWIGSGAGRAALRSKALQVNALRTQCVSCRTPRAALLEKH